MSWTLRPAHPGWTTEQYRTVARAALDELTCDPRIHLVWLVWPSREPIRDGSPADLADSSWNDIGDGPYLAIDRN